MSESLGAIVAMTLFIMVTGATFMSLLEVWDQQSSESRVATLRRMDQLNTRVSITSTAVSGADCDTFTATVSNPGKTSVGDFSEIDFIADYTDTNSNKVAARLDYVSGAVAADQWTISTIAPDTRDPNTWNPREVATIDFEVHPSLSTAVSGTMVLATPFGITDTAYFGC